LRGAACGFDARLSGRAAVVKAKASRDRFRLRLYFAL
jgi:hypothetical protein